MRDRSLDAGDRSLQRRWRWICGVGLITGAMDLKAGDGSGDDGGGEGGGYGVVLRWRGENIDICIK